MSVNIDVLTYLLEVPGESTDSLHPDRTSVREEGRRNLNGDNLTFRCKF